MHATKDGCPETASLKGGRRMEFLDAGTASDAGPRVNVPESHRWSKVARARQQVIFPVTEMKPMPAEN